MKRNMNAHASVYTNARTRRHTNTSTNTQWEASVCLQTQAKSTVTTSLAQFFMQQLATSVETKYIVNTLSIYRINSCIRAAEWVVSVCLSMQLSTITATWQSTNNWSMACTITILYIIYAQMSSYSTSSLASISINMIHVLLMVNYNSKCTIKALLLGLLSTVTSYKIGYEGWFVKT